MIDKGHVHCHIDIEIVVQPDHAPLEATTLSRIIGGGRKKIDRSRWIGSGGLFQTFPNDGIGQIATLHPSTHVLRQHLTGTIEHTLGKHPFDRIVIEYLGRHRGMAFAHVSVLQALDAGINRDIAGGARFIGCRKVDVAKQECRHEDIYTQKDQCQAKGRLTKKVRLDDLAQQVHSAQVGDSLSEGQKWIWHQAFS